MESRRGCCTQEMDHMTTHVGPAVFEAATRITAAASINQEITLYMKDIIPEGRFTYGSGYASGPGAESEFFEAFMKQLSYQDDLNGMCANFKQLILEALEWSHDAAGNICVLVEDEDPKTRFYRPQRERFRIEYRPS